MNAFWNDKIQKRINNIIECKSILEDQKIRKLVPDLLIEKITSFIEKTEKAEFQIAFVGTIKAGKSSLINALLNGDFASTNVAPETAVLTKFGDSESDSYFIDVTYYSKVEWEQIWNQVISAKNSADFKVRDKIRPFVEEYNHLNAGSVKHEFLDKAKEHFVCDSKKQLARLISKYTSSSSQAHYFVKEVFVGIKNSGLPPRVVLCDTPGLDDVLDYRSNVTKRYINQADVVLICVVSKFLASEQLHTIMEVFSLEQNRFHPERVYVIGTQIDSLAKPEEDWKKQKDEWVKYLSGTACYNSRKLAVRNIVGVSAWIERLIYENIKNRFNSSSKEYWALGSFALNYGIDPREMQKAENIKKLHKAACVKPLMNILNNRVYGVYKESMEQDFYCQNNLLCSEIEEKIQIILSENEELRRALLSESEKLEKLLNRAKKQIKTTEVSEKEFERINRELSERRKSISQDIERALKPFLN